MLQRLESSIQRVRRSPLVKHTWSVFKLLYSLRYFAGKSGSISFRTIGEKKSSSSSSSSTSKPDKANEGEEASALLSTDNALPSLSHDTGNGEQTRREAHQAKLAKEHGYRIASFSHELSEQILLRDVVFALQGIDGEYIKYDIALKGYVVDAGVGVPAPTRQLIRKICEAGWLFRRIMTFLEKCKSSHTAGLVEQGMCHAMQDEITEYYRLIAVLKEQVNIDSQVLEQSHQDRLSLRRLYVWMQDPIERLRLMAALAAGTVGLHGGALASTVHSHTRHGDPFVNTFITTQMAALAAPLLNMTREWVIEVRFLFVFVRVLTPTNRI